jgi:hypothetical protein
MKAFNMPQLTNLVLTDRAATPVNHTFTPKSKENGVAVVSKSTGVPIGDPKYTISTGKTAGGRMKTTLKLSVPVVQTQTINGVSTPVVVRTAYVDATFSFSSDSSLQERKDAVGMFQSSLAASAALTDGVLTAGEGIW